MATFLATANIPKVDLHIVRRDSFDGMTLLLQEADGAPVNLVGVGISAGIWNTTTGTQVTALNVERLEPYANGQVRLWLSSTQTGLVWDAATSLDSPYTLMSSFFPSAYSEARGADLVPLAWDVRIERPDPVADLISVASGVFTTQTDHGLGATDRVIFTGTNQTSINYEGTRIYTTLTNLTYVAPYRFTIATLSGVTANPLGGIVSRLKQDTVVAGNVFVGGTYSNAFV